METPQGVQVLNADRRSLTARGFAASMSTGRSLACPAEPSLGIAARAGPRGLGALIERLERLVVGQRPLLERLVIALLAGGHVLIEGVPGLAKTRAVRALAQALDLPFRRIQFTPDLLPADLTGTQIYRPATGTFDVRPGPIVTSVLLADEINRAPAKVQSALLEAMQEGQITVGDETIVLPETFWVLATQNPIEHEGTYPLPEAQLDRFLMKLLVGYPDRDAELAMLDLPSVAETSHAESWTGDEPAAVRPGRRARVPRPGRLDPGRAGDQGIRGRPRPGHPRPRRVRPRPRPAARAGRQPPGHDRPGPRRPRPRPALPAATTSRPHDVKTPRPRRPPPPDHDQLRGRRRGPLRRRHPRPDPRPHPGALIDADRADATRCQDAAAASIGRLRAAPRPLSAYRASGSRESQNQ